MEPKPQIGSRRTRDRILDISLRLFNEVGAPNVTTTTIAEAMGISNGNLYYHFRNKDDIINSIFVQFEQEMERRLKLPGDHRPTLGQSWGYLQHMSEFMWSYRFLYRDINYLLASNRMLETNFKRVVDQKKRFASELCRQFLESEEMEASAEQVDVITTNMVVLVTYWLSFQFIQHPRQYNDSKQIRSYLHSASYHILSVLAPYLRGQAWQSFEQLAREFAAAMAQNDQGTRSLEGGAAKRGK
ncbi:TetR/AcrR family transcriptional regulator [Cupriavidus oxalaticus]|uniref:TetR/AcrR family transcriptional regulator n=1 Tax=Cupriavidus oxalaticus TaxID=96344 RepID=A0A4P7LK50_9BURK|nr:TetR/AcrR family transcriptional regulator [Cupriavidus oxalaticus]QBY56205.1 TetR/AcrR family transcriptional regulator [Cupriavidus oxalaticus]